MMNSQQLRRTREVLAAMPAKQPPRGQKPDWGENINRNRAYLLAQENGMNVTTACTNCDADVFDFLKSEVDAADSFAQDQRA